MNQPRTIRLQRRPRPRRHHVWLWLLGAVALAVAMCAGGIYVVLKPRPTFGTMSVRHSVSIPDLAPDGFRQSIVAEKKVYSIGQHTDGTIEVVTLDLPTGAKVSQQPAKAARWRGAQLAGDWVVIESEPGPDGKRVVAFTNVVNNVQQSHTIARDDTIHLVPPAANVTATVELTFFVISPSAATVRTMSVDRAGVHPGVAHTLPRGARPAGRIAKTTAPILHLIDGDGTMWVYPGYKNPERWNVTVPRGHPAELFAVIDGVLIVAENKLDYQVFRNEAPQMRGEADRKPVWVGQCGDQVCVVDEVPGDPLTRQVVVATDPHRRRVSVPHAAPGSVIEESGGTLLVPIVNGQEQATVAATAEDKTRTHAGRMLVTGDDAAVLIPFGPPGSPQTWGTSAQQVRLVGVDLDADLRTELGTALIRPSGCSTDNYVLACPDAEGFTVWRVG